MGQLKMFPVWVSFWCGNELSLFIYLVIAFLHSVC